MVNSFCIQFKCQDVNPKLAKKAQVRSILEQHKLYMENKSKPKSPTKPLSHSQSDTAIKSAKELVEMSKKIHRCHIYGSAVRLSRDSKSATSLPSKTNSLPR